MRRLDWMILWVSILVVLLAGLPFRRYIKSVKDYLLAGRTQPWYLLAPSCQAVQCDVGDFFGAAAFIYQHGLFGLTYWIVALPFGWLLGANITVPYLYRSGVWTPAEWLEVRFNAPARFWGALLVVLQRVFVMGNMILGTALLFKVLVGSPMLWGAGIAIFLGSLYVLFGGVAATVTVGTAQLILMSVGAWAMLIIGWSKTGGLAAVAAQFPQYLHVATQPSFPQLLPGLALLGSLFSVGGYPIYQAEQTSRPLSARTEHDARLGFLLAGPVCYIHQGAILITGLFGLLLYGAANSTLTPRDILYPLMMVKFLPSGLLGIVAASVMAATISTVAANAQSCAGMVTRDIYGRLLYKRGSDHHYMRVSQVLTALWFLIGAALVPLIAKGGMANTYVKVTGAYVTPLMPTMLLSVLYRRASRWAGFGAMILGGTFGTFVTVIPVIKLGVWGHFLVFPLVNFVFSALAFLLISELENALRGVRPRAEWEGLVMGTFPENLRQYRNIEEVIRTRAYIEADSQAVMDSALAEGAVVLKAGKPIYGSSGIPWYKQVWFWTVVLGVVEVLTVIILW